MELASYYLSHLIETILLSFILTKPSFSNTTCSPSIRLVNTIEVIIEGTFSLGIQDPLLIMVVPLLHSCLR